MSKLWDRLRGRTEQRDAGNDPSWGAMLGGGLSTSGQHVNAKSAESLSTVFACVQALSESVSCLPLHVFQRTEDGERRRVNDHPLARVLIEPNDYQSGLAFRESMTAAVLLEGNAYARIVTNASGELAALHPLNPRSVTIVKLANGRFRYDWTDDAGRVVPLLQDEVLHLRDRTEAGSIVGKSRIAIARETLGLSLTLRAHGAGVFGRGARPASILSNEGTRDLNTEELTHLQSRLREYSNPTNSGRTLILPRGLKYATVGLSNEDSEWLSAQQFSVEEVCRIYRVPPTMVGDLRHGNYSNTAELGSQLVRYSLARPIAMWEAEISRSLLGPIARRRFHAEHSVEGLLRGNPEARADFYSKAIAAGWMTVNEVRKYENLPPLAALAVDD